MVSLGTSGAVFGEHPRPVFDTGGDVASFASATGSHLPLMCTLNAARVLTAAAQMLDTDLAGLDALALAAEPGAGGLTLLPYLDGERTPNLPEATGTLGGITRANATPENLARAAVEGMLCNLVSGVGLPDPARRRGRRVLLIGGASASAAVRAIAPMLFGVPVVVRAPASTSPSVPRDKQPGLCAAGTSRPRGMSARTPSSTRNRGRRLAHHQPVRLAAAGRARALIPARKG